MATSGLETAKPTSAGTYMNTKVIHDFLKDFNKNNSLDWMKNNRKYYETAKNIFVYAYLDNEPEKHSKAKFLFENTLIGEKIIISTQVVNCEVVYSEDMQHGQIIENTFKIVNPFVG